MSGWAQAIELGNIPESLPSFSGNTSSGASRWSLGSLSLLPTSGGGGPTSCMSDDADDDYDNTLVSSSIMLRQYTSYAANSGFADGSADGCVICFI